LSKPQPLYLSAAVSTVSAALSIAGYRKAVAAGLDASEQKVKLQRTLAKVAVDLFFAWRLAKAASR
jgi:hypothetical protein